MLSSHSNITVIVIPAVPSSLPASNRCAFSSASIQPRPLVLLLPALCSALSLLWPSLALLSKRSIRINPRRNVSRFFRFLFLFFLSSFFSLFFLPIRFPLSLPPIRPPIPIPVNSSQPSSHPINSTWDSSIRDEIGLYKYLYLLINPVSTGLVPSSDSSPPTDRDLRMALLGNNINNSPHICEPPSPPLFLVSLYRSHPSSPQIISNRE